MTSFPEAKSIKAFEIEGKIYRQVPLSEGVEAPDAIRATIAPGTKGEKTAFFVPFDDDKLSLKDL